MVITYDELLLNNLTQVVLECVGYQNTVHPFASEMVNKISRKRHLKN